MKLVNVSLAAALYALVPAFATACDVSCKHAYYRQAANGGTAVSGLFDICPTGDPKQTHSVYCDQTTDGGGWMLILSYQHAGGTDNALQPNTLPVDPDNGFSHLNDLSSLGYSGYDAAYIDSVRFYCSTSAHTRKVHFKTSNAAIKGIALTGNQGANSASLWTNGATQLNGHNANLPAATDRVYTNADGGFHEFPFYKAGANHWAIKGRTVGTAGDRWECDDYNGGSTADTHHQVWVRMVGPSHCPVSCKHVFNRQVATGGTATSGQFEICPTGNPTQTHSVYCDQTTDGGGWMLILSYKRDFPTNNALQPTTLPVDPDNGYSHLEDLSSLGYDVADIHAVRFYCTTSTHNRKVHFKTSNAAIKGMSLTGNQGANSASRWTSGFTKLNGHNAYLPAATDTVFTNANGGFHEFPFFKASYYHWGVKGLGSRWECDDAPGSTAANTHHQVWVRMGDTFDPPTAAPSESPSTSPSRSPSASPSRPPSTSPSTAAPSASPSTAAPSASPSTAAPSKAPTPPRTASSSGDPHFKTWSGSKFDFHGQCDLVLLNNKGFANGLGLRIHIRTKIETWWSYIESAVIQIGDQILELKGGAEGEGPHYWVNSLPGQEEDVDQDPNLKMLAEHLESQLAGFKVIYKRVSSKQHKFRINLSHAGDAISMETYKDWISVNVAAKKSVNFEGTSGLMGSYPNGVKVARDGLTIMNDPAAFGFEWQVTNKEPMLFHSLEAPQHPMGCNMPNERSSMTKRRLGESLVSEEDASRVCARAHGDDLDACIFDVLATNDKDRAGAY